MSIGSMGVIGAGQMGVGVAQVAAQAGVKVVLNDINEALCLRGLQGLERNLERTVQRGRLKPEERDRVIRNIHTSENLEDLRSVDFVLEAVIEQEDAKIALFQKLDKICPPEVIFASNTSSISITRMGARTSRADRFIGMHFMNPVP
ncbi:MAG: 3-hydroxyacyl-CoA dehydrogenase family protein, partial [Candidatus Binataceae bacterium]